jgi:ferredoxin-type protein NapH
LLGTASLVRIRADKRAQCNDCMDCFAVCPEPQIIKPALKGAAKNIGPVILSAQCTNCGRCIDVCSKDVFAFGLRFDNKADSSAPQGKAPALR